VCGHWQRYKTHEQKQLDGTSKQVRQAGDLIRNVFQPAIEEVVFHQAQRMMTRQVGATNARKLPLSGLVICSVCGGNFAKRNANARSASATMSCHARMTDKNACSNSKSYPLKVLWAVYFGTMNEYVANSIRKTQLSVSEKAKILLRARIDENVAKRKRLAQFITDGDDVVMVEQYNALKLEYDGLAAELEALPTIADANHIDIVQLYGKISDDPFAVSKLLQLNGYRIVCDESGRMMVDHLTFTYQGYNRIGKTFIIGVPGGGTETYESMLSSGGGSYDPEAYTERLPDEYPPDQEDEDEDALVFEWKAKS
jgi:hypothetical protein